MKKEYITYETLIQELNGRDVNYNDLLLTVEWSKKREEILRRDSYHCSKCGKDSTIEHYDQKSHKKFHLWLGELKPTLVKREDGRSEEIYRPEVTVSNKAYHMHVHHRFYILNRLPWEYDNEVLITLCNWCHWDLHQNEDAVVFNEDGLTKAEMRPCRRCLGAGWFPEYYHVEAGVCFRCRGSRYEKPLIRIKNES